MTESEFINFGERLFARIRDDIERQSDAFDCECDGNVLSLEHDNGQTVIVNRHNATQELWIAAKSGGYHFARRGDGTWFSERENADFFEVLNRVLLAASGENFDLRPEEKA